MKKIYKRIILIWILITLLIQTSLYAIPDVDSENAPLETSTDGIDIASEHALLVEPTTDTIIYERDAHIKAYPASLTKILCALVALENSNLSDKIIVSENAIKLVPKGYSIANFAVGEEITIEIALEALLLHSANEAANVISEAISGSVEAFADKMNQRALELGCENTHFVNGNGIHNEDHYTTAWDLYLIAKECMKNEEFRRIILLKETTIPPSPQHPADDRVFKNTNKLLIEGNKYYYQGAIGMKTGFTSEAKNCFIGAASRNGYELINIVLGAPTIDGESQRYPDIIKLFDYGFDNYKKDDLMSDGQIIKTIEIKNGTKETRTLQLMIEKGFSGFVKNGFDINNVEPQINYSQKLVAPITAGTVLGTATYNIGTQKFTTNIIAKTDVIERTYYEIYIIIGGFVLLIIGLLILIIRKKKNNEQKA